MADAAIAVDRGESLELRLALAAEISLHHDLLSLDDLCDFHELILAELSGADIRIDAGVLQDAARQGAADAEHVCERSFNALLVGDFDA